MIPSSLLDSPLGVRLAETLAHFLWQGTALGALVLVVALLLRRSSPNTRYTVYVAAMLLMAACPIVTFLVLSAPPAAVMHVEFAQDQPDAVPSPALAEVSATPLPARVSPPDGFTGHGVIPVRAAESKPPAPAKPTVYLEEPPTWHRFVPYAVAAYLLGVMLFLGRLLLALAGGRRLGRAARPVDATPLLVALAAGVQRLGCRCTPALAYSQRVLVPTVIGILRPTILLPLSASTGLSAEQIEILLLHELGHIRRLDHLFNILQRVIEALLFFHPVVWLVSRQIRLERELCCDDLVVATLGQSHAYADSLVQLAELSLRPRFPGQLAAVAATAATGQPSQLRYRIVRLLEGRDCRRFRLTFGGLLSLVTTVAVASAVIAYWPGAARPEALPAWAAGQAFREGRYGEAERLNTSALAEAENLGADDPGAAAGQDGLPYVLDTSAFAGQLAAANGEDARQAVLARRWEAVTRAIAYCNAGGGAGSYHRSSMYWYSGFTGGEKVEPKGNLDKPVELEGGGAVIIRGDCLADLTVKDHSIIHIYGDLEAKITTTDNVQCEIIIAGDIKPKGTIDAAGIVMIFVGGNVNGNIRNRDTSFITWINGDLNGTVETGRTSLHVMGDFNGSMRRLDTATPASATLDVQGFMSADKIKAVTRQKFVDFQASIGFSDIAAGLYPEPHGYSNARWVVHARRY